MKKLVLAAAILMTAPAAAIAEGDVENGRTVYNKCSVCHKIGDGAKNALGPQLTCVVGRKVGVVEGYKYSAAAKDGAKATSESLKGGVWDDASLLAWFEKDDKVIPGNKMIFPAGVKDEQDRIDLLAYIKSECTE